MLRLLQLFQYGREGLGKSSEVGASGPGPQEPEILEKSLSFETLFSHLGEKEIIPLIHGVVVKTSITCDISKLSSGSILYTVCL